MTKRLYIHDEAPEEIKTNIDLAQDCLDNMLGYQDKANNKTLTLEDLDKMVNRNHAIIDKFPAGNPSSAGLPTKIDGIDDVIALAATRRAEATSLMAKNPPVHSAGSIKDLHTLCQKPPEEIGDTIIDAAEQKNHKEKPVESIDKQESVKEDLKTPKKLPVSELDFKMFNDHLVKTAELLTTCKQIYF
ncbi:MAG: hypothetical protein MJE63_23665, partial [Proteobacteria bacterium]|nr:hypothetical protein [Pseudomonadota bacterium]